MKKRYIFWLAPVAMLAWASCKDKTAKQDAPPPPTPVNVTEALKGDAVYYDQYQGTVVSLNNVELRSQVSGFITGIYFKEGEVVQKGKPLYEIDKRKFQDALVQAQANLANANANLVKAQKDLDRYNMLLKNDAVARQTVDQATAVYETSRGQVSVAKAAVASARTDLSYATITAPVTGRIGISQVRLGSQVSAGTTLLNTVSSENPIGVDVVINEQDINRFYDLEKSSTDSTFKLVLSDGVTFYKKPGKILAIDRGVNNQTGSIKVRVQFPNDQAILKDGMSATLKVLNNKSGDRVIIPYKAVTEQMGEFFVFVTKDTTMKQKEGADKRDTIALQRKVILGPRLSDKVVIMTGINAGDKVITDGFQRLRDSGMVTLGAAPAPGAAGGKPAKK
ncbi:efflux RND transporter periplasmic adaptor subunit [Mucilaginibacter sp. UR6-11]|uniref:efflux RND transporter periplasmic adaptor subunit n=1 Tax=Mucilaginibacter sp. UR6-11 TaxID=1435644 RepID=UPI001E5467D3|nr:efflux RND transporter periplasmic adaptor subunit [Mucilaginibacter sp. UR6-11]MCC8426231.1 efflux RND transporter periplasmic adaptor subunit [Mucilaginibacter sp. UR6-11]